MATQRIIISNDDSSITTMQVEPWGQEFALAPNQSFEVFAHDAGENFHFVVNLRGERYITVFPEGDFSRVSVRQNGDEIFNAT